jgi:murein DD-endopeptidase MepM/ murein hydrolase activator NlpD
VLHRVARILLGALVVALALAPRQASALAVRVVPPSPRLGEVAVVYVTGAARAREVEGILLGRPLHFFPHGDGYAALVGIDLETKPGKAPWRVGITDAGGASRQVSGSIAVGSRKFPVQRLTLPTPMVNLDPEAERRAADEAARLRALYETVTPERLWLGRFARPVGGDGPGDGFGSRRIINGQPRSPHSGVDFSADRGAPVLAANRGRVVLVAEFFFAGRLVVLDHGLGLYTLYFHLDRQDVAEGVLVEQGQPIGTVGATGRATGPHLHWAAHLGLTRVDPLTLLTLAVRD